MADNLVLSAGTEDGATIATDDITSVHYPISKLAHGALDSATLVSTSSGLPVAQQGTWNVNLGATDNAVLDDIAAQAAAILAALGGTLAISHAALTELAAAINASSQLDVNIAASGATVPVSAASLPLPTGAATAAKQDTGNTSLGTIAGAVSGTEMQVDVLTLPALPAGNNNIGDVDIASIAAGDNNIGNVDVVTLPALPAGTNNIGDVDVLSIAAGTNTIGDVGVKPRASGGLTTAMFSGSDGSSILVATAQVVKASAGQLFGYYAYNPEAAVTFVHFYNTAAASVTVGTTNPLFTLPIPAGSAANLMSDIGIVFSNAGWSVAATTTAGGNTAPATGVSLVVWFA